jgi:hypothetical protein
VFFLTQAGMEEVGWEMVFEYESSPRNIMVAARKGEARLGGS